MTDSKNSRDAVRRQIYIDARLNRSYVLMNALATVVACYGLLLNSAAVVIGAMIIAMLLGPIPGVALGLVDGDHRLLRKALATESVGATLVLGIAFVIGLAHQDIGVGSELLARTKPNIMDEIVALAGGAAAAYALTTSRVSASLVGVAIATALVPPLAGAGLLLARGETSLATGAALLYVANLVAVQFAFSVVLWVQGYHFEISRGEKGTWTGVLVGNVLSVALLAALTGLLAYNSYESVRLEQDQRLIREAVQNQVAARPGLELVDYTETEADGVLSLRITVRAQWEPTYAEVLSLQTDIATQLQRPTACTLNIIRARELDALIPPTLTATPTETATASPTATAMPSPTPRATMTGSPTPNGTAATPTATSTNATAVPSVAGLGADLENYTGRLESGARTLAR